MRFPFAIAATITLKTADYNISSEQYLLLHIEEGLEDLRMSRMRAGEHQLLLQNTDLVRGLDRKTFLRNLLVTVDIDRQEIRLRLETETILFFVMGLIPILTILAGKAMFPFVALGLFIWGVGYLVKSLVLQSVRNDVEMIVGWLK